MNEILAHYREIMTDPAHLMAEISLMILVDVLFLGVIWPLIVRRIRKEHKVVDEEHGFEHDEDTVWWPWGDEPIPYTPAEEVLNDQTH